MPLLRSGVLCYTVAKQPEQFRCGGTPIGLRPLPPAGEASGRLIAAPTAEREGSTWKCDDGVRRHTAALLNPCDAVQILCSPKLRFSRALTCLVFPYSAFAVLYQASAFQSFAMPTPDDSMPLLLYAFPWPSFAKPFPCYSEPCLCGSGARAAQRTLLKSAALCRCFATPRLATAPQSISFALLSKTTALGFHAPAPRFAIPEHHNADAICCFSYAVYFQAFAMPRQSHARPKHRCAKPLRRLSLQSRNDAIQCHCSAPLRFALPLRYKAGAWDAEQCSALRGRLPQSRRLAAATAPSEREPGIRGSGSRWGWLRRQNGGKRCPGGYRSGWC